MVHSDGCADLNGFFNADQSKDVFSSEKQNMLNVQDGPEGIMLTGIQC